MKHLLLYIMLFMCVNTQAQNLVANPSFEDYVTCPTSFTPVNFSTGIAYNPAYNSFVTVKDWISPLKNTTPDYFNTCASATASGSVHVPNNFMGYQEPHSGSAYAGIYPVNGFAVNNTIPNFSCEYIETKLLQPMQAGHQYYVSCYVNYSGMMSPLIPSFVNRVMIDKVQMQFSNSVNYSSTANVITGNASVSNAAGNFITDTVNWVKIQGTYTAAGNEDWLTLGAFKDTTAPAFMPYGSFNPAYECESYIYIDDICVVDMANVLTSARDTSICPQSFPITIHGTDTGGRYVWNTGDTTANLVVHDTGTYWVQVFGECVFYADTINVKQTPIPDAQLGHDTSFCNVTVYQLSAQGQYNSYLWNTGATTSSISVTQSGQYIVTVANNCTVQNDTINIAFSFTPAKPVVHDTVICQNAVSPILNVAGDSLRWYTSVNDTGSNRQPVINTAVVGIDSIYVSRYNKCGESDRATIHIQVEGAPLGILENDTTLCKGSPVELDAISVNAQYLWSTGDTTKSIIVTDMSGAYFLTTSNTCGISQDTVQVTFADCDSCLLIPNAFTPNGDGLNDFFNIIPRCKVVTYYIAIANRWGQVVFQSYNIKQSWNGTFNGIPADVGTYFYVIQAYPELAGGRIINVKGDVILIR